MKSFLYSKKFWFNFLTVVVAVASHYGFTPDAELTAQVATGLVLISPVINLVLTLFYTKTPITASLK